MQEVGSNSAQITIPRDSVMSHRDFIYGVSTSAYQIEGGRDSREPSIWDTFCAQANTISDHSNGDTACNHFQLWRDDISLLQNLGVDAYRFSIAWPRVMKSDGQINHSGLDFYRQLIDGLLEADIKPFITFYHWDLPQSLEDQGGWLNRDTAYRFQEYVAQTTPFFSNTVASYTTLNEPFCSACLGYELGIHAPGIKGKEYGYKAAHHLLLAHGLGMQVLQETAPQASNGIVLNVSPMYPETDSEQDIQAVKWADEHVNHWYLQPLIEGQYPELLENLNETCRPEIQADDLAIISTPIDFLGLNYYTRTVVKQSADELFQVVEPTNVEITDMGWEVFPEGFTEILTQLNNQYNLPPIYLTENGAAMSDRMVDGEVHDISRLKYYQAHLLAVDKAIQKGVNVKGYFAWSLMDNFEWAFGYSKRFGMVYVDYKTQKRTLKQSGMAYRDFLNHRSSLHAQ